MAALVIAASAANVVELRADVDLAYQPMRVDLQVIKGQMHTGAVQLKNQGTQAIHLRARMQDFAVSEDNTPQFGPQNDDSYSCKNWAVLNPVEVDIPAGAIVPFRYTLKVPQNPDLISRTYRCALVFETMPTLEDRIQQRSSNQVRLVTVLYATVGTPAATPEIGTLSVLNEESEWHLNIPFSNLGETHYRLNGQIFIRNAEDRTIQTLDMDSSPIHPGTSVRIAYPIEPLDAGDYKLVLQLKIGNRILEKETAVEVVGQQ